MKKVLTIILPVLLLFLSGAVAYSQVTSINVTAPSSVITEIPGSLSLTATVLPADATDRSVTWSVSDESIAFILPGVDNYSTNPGFDVDATGWGGWGGSSTRELSPEGRTGNGFAVTNPTAAGFWTVQVAHPWNRELEWGGTYHLSFWVKNIGGATGQIRPEVQSASWEPGANQFVPGIFVPTAEWTQYVGTLTLPYPAPDHAQNPGTPSPPRARLILSVGEMAGTFIIDDVVMRKAGAPDLGILTSITEGSVTVTATSNSNPDVEGSMVITIGVPPAVTGVTVTSPADVITTLGGTLQMSAAVAPETADQAVTWSVDNSAVATISATGLLTAVSNGTVVVTATSVANPAISTTRTITVAAVVSIPVTGITVTSPADTIKVAGGTLQMAATVVPSDATNPAVTWSVDASAVATIDAAGLLTAVGNGNVVVTATSVSEPAVSGTKTIVVDFPVGVPAVGSAFTLYPVPVESRLFIQSDIAVEYVEVFSLDGRSKLISALLNKESSVDVSSLRPGTYILRVNKVNGEVITRTFVKK